jgi:hypothetical protein
MSSCASLYFARYGQRRSELFHRAAGRRRNCSLSLCIQTILGQPVHSKTVAATRRPSGTASNAQWLDMNATLLSPYFLPPAGTHLLVSVDVTPPALVVALAGSSIIPLCPSHAPEASLALHYLPRACQVDDHHDRRTPIRSRSSRANQAIPTFLSIEQQCRNTPDDFNASLVYPRRNGHDQTPSCTHKQHLAPASSAHDFPYVWPRWIHLLTPSPLPPPRCPIAFVLP